MIDSCQTTDVINSFRINGRAINSPRFLSVNVNVVFVTVCASTRYWQIFYAAGIFFTVTGQSFMRLIEINGNIVNS